MDEFDNNTQPLLHQEFFDVGNQTQPNKIMVAIQYFLSGTTALANIPAIIVVILSYCKKTNFKNCAVLLSLSASDFLFSVIWISMIETYSNPDIDTSFTECLIRWVAAGTSYYVSNIHILCISMDRILVLCFDMVSIKTNRQLVTLFCTVISWFFPLTIVLLMAIFRSHDTGETGCSLSRIFPKGTPYMSIFLLVIQTGILVNTIILVGYLRYHQIQMKNINVSGRRDNKTIITICIISTVCTTLNIPWSCLMLYGTIVEWPSRFTRFTIFIFSAMTSFVNPIVYVLRIKKFRALLFRTVRWGFCMTRGKNIESNSSYSHSHETDRAGKSDFKKLDGLRKYRH